MGYLYEPRSTSSDELFRSISSVLIGIGRPPVQVPTSPPEADRGVTDPASLLPGITLPTSDVIQVDLGRLPRLDLPSLLPDLNGIGNGFLRSPWLQPILDRVVRIVRPPEDSVDGDRDAAGLPLPAEDPHQPDESDDDSVDEPTGDHEGGEHEDTATDPREGSDSDDIRDPADDALKPVDPPITIPALIEESEPNDAVGQATDIRLGVMVRGRLADHRDIDWFDLGDLKPGEIEVNFKSPSNLLGLVDSYVLTLHDDQGLALHKFSISQSSGFTFRLDQPIIGAHLSIQAASSWLIDSRDYGFRVDHRPLEEGTPTAPNAEHEFNDRPDLANPLALGDFVSGRLASRLDQDWFVTDTDQAGPVRIALDFKSSSRWLSLVMVEVVDDSGNVRAQATAGSRLVLEVAAEAGERLYVGLSSVGLMQDDSAYRLKLSMPDPAPPSLPPSSAEVISGSARAERLQGTESNDVFDGRGGDDTLEGGGGIDVAVFRSSIQDLSLFDYGPLHVVRGSFAAGVHAGTATRLVGVETLRTNEGDIPLVAPQVDPIPMVTAAIDTLRWSIDPDERIAPPFNPGLYPEIVLGSRRAERLVGSDGDDLIDGAGGADTIVGGAGLDTLAILAPAQSFDVQSIQGVTRIRGLDGAFEYAGHRVVTVDVETLAFAQGDSVALSSSGGRTVRLGTSGSDILRGGDADEVFDGLGGSDVIDGGAGQDTLVLFAPKDAFSISALDPSRPEFIVRATAGAEGEYARQTILLRNVERVVFADGEQALAAPPRLVLSSSVTQLTEGGEAAAVNVSLSAAPSSALTVSVRAGSDLSAEPATLNFTPDNWDQIQTLAVNALDDDLIEPTEKALLEFVVNDALQADARSLRPQALTFTVFDNDTPQLGAISGRLWHDTNLDGDASPDEPGLAGWVVFIDRNGDGLPGAGDAQARSDLDGAWRLDGLDAGEYVVQAMVRPGWQPASEAVASDGATLVDDNGGTGQIMSPDFDLIEISAAQADALSTHLGEATQLGAFRADPRFAGIDGHGTAIVIIDTGVDLDHAAFGPDSDGDGVADRIVYHYDFSGAGDADASDPNGHGTHVAGIAAGQGAYAGIASGADLIVLKVLDERGQGRSFDLREAVDWVVQNVDQYNIVAVNLSLGFGDFDTEATTGFLTSPFKALADNGVTVVAASGNGYAKNPVQGVSYPSSDPWAMSVGAVWAGDGVLGSPTQNGSVDDIAAFSQRDDTESDIFAPGVQIRSAWLDGGYQMLSGTSMATPQVSGMIALVQQLAIEQLGRRLTVAEVRSLIESTADVIVDDAATQGDGALPNTGLSFGRINMLALAESILDQPPLVSQTVTVLEGGTTSDVNFGFVPLQSPDGQALDDLIVGTRWGEQLSGAAGSDRLIGGAGDDTLLGGEGDDWLMPGVGNDFVDGGAGQDTVSYAGRSTDYRIDRVSPGSIRVESAFDGSIDRLIDIEWLSFEDGLVSAEGMAPVALDDIQKTTDAQTLAGAFDPMSDPMLDSGLLFFAETTTPLPPALTLTQIQQMFEVRTSLEGSVPLLELWVKGDRGVTAADIEIVFNPLQASFSDTVTVPNSTTSLRVPAGWDGQASEGGAGGSNGVVSAQVLYGTESSALVGGVDGQRLAAFVLSPAAGVPSIDDIQIRLKGFDDDQGYSYGSVAGGTSVTQPVVLNAAYDIPLALTADLSGMVYHWKSHALMSGVEVSAATGVSAGTSPAGSPGKSIEFRNLVFNGPSEALVEVWAKPNTSVANFNFTFDLGSDLALTYESNSALSANWSIVDSIVGGDLAVSGMSSTSSLSVATKLGVVKVSSLASLTEFDLAMLGGELGQEAVAPHLVTAARAISGSQGDYLIDGLLSQEQLVRASLLADNTGITSGDALAALRISVGIHPNSPSVPLSPYQIIAADANGSGTITAGDALAILRMSVNHALAPKRQWFFIREDADFWDGQTMAISKERVVWEKDGFLTTPDGLDDLNWVGVLKGDVNGSWRPLDAQGMPITAGNYAALPTSYFSDLATQLGVPVAQWG
jgi:subtilisin family serine protease